MRSWKNNEDGKIRSITTFNHIDISRGGKELEKISAIGRGSLSIPDN